MLLYFSRLVLFFIQTVHLLFSVHHSSTYPHDCVCFFCELCLFFLIFSHHFLLSEFSALCISAAIIQNKSQIASYSLKSPKFQFHVVKGIPNRYKSNYNFFFEFNFSIDRFGRFLKTINEKKLQLIID